MADTLVMPCTCPSTFQDQRYGRDKRLHNKRLSNKTNVPEYRCTICGTSRGPGGGGK